ncbi:MAG TPA: hypothetical protein VKD24_04810, partial [Candidatus Angelobacter sp.]|nr:hypothetical protein [Candidatus Angelobacter sp.]
MKQGLARYQKEKEEAWRREEERLRREAEELRRRLEEEDRRRRESEAAAARRKLEEEALAEAAANEAAGDHQTAELILEHAIGKPRLYRSLATGARSSPDSGGGGDNAEGPRSWLPPSASVAAGLRA